MKNDSSHHIGDLVYDQYRKSLGFIIYEINNTIYTNPTNMNSYVVQWIDDQYSLNGIRYSTREISFMKKDLEQYMEKQI